VRPERQRQGIGSALIRRGLILSRERRCAAVVVLGSPAYYGRFGFTADLARELRAPYSGPAFMALEIEPGALARRGAVQYPAAFQALD
jgi:putative acetyltransferase